MKIDLFGMNLEEIYDVLKPFGLQKYKARQIACWMYQRGINDFNCMTDLSKQHRNILSDNFYISKVHDKAVQVSNDNKTTKYLLELSDGMAVETVLMRQPYGNSVCISTQVGCAMGCVFCASTLHGVERNLSAGEILAQVIYINNFLSREGEKVDTIVIMGSGEPLANYDNVLKFIRLCHEDYCLNISYRSITLSTSGIVPGIFRLAEEQIPITLAVSLHAPNDNIRARLMPINRRYQINEVIAAADAYAKNTGRRVTYEYILIAVMNSKREHAFELSQLLKGRLANVNLIPINPVPERGLLRPDDKTIKTFESVLLQHQVNVTIRREMGTDIQAACGQLRHKVIKDSD